MKVTWSNRSTDTGHTGKEAANLDSSSFIEEKYGLCLLFSIEPRERADTNFSGTTTPALKETVQMAVAGAPLIQIEDIAPMVRQTSTRHSAFYADGLQTVWKGKSFASRGEFSKSGEL